MLHWLSSTWWGGLAVFWVICLIAFALLYLAEVLREDTEVEAYQRQMEDWRRELREEAESRRAELEGFGTIDDIAGVH